VEEEHDEYDDEDDFERDPNSDLHYEMIGETSSKHVQSPQTHRVANSQRHSNITEEDYEAEESYECKL